jgi:predicted ArsR family transcriptional regulator
MTKQTKPKTKKAQLIQLLTRKAGADVATISEKLGWLPHTTRAALTGLRKAGFEISAEKPGNGKPSCYRILDKSVEETV